MIVPIFTSHYSIGKSILTLDRASDSEIDELKPVSIFSIAKKNNLESVFLLETSFTGFIEAYKNSEKSSIPYCFGIKVAVCNELERHEEESLATESKINIWMLNTQGYNDLVKIISLASTKGFYRRPRIDWKSLNQLMTENLKVTIPFYSSFIAKNYLHNGSSTPDFNFKPQFHIENHSLPFDSLIKERVKSYCDSYNLTTIDTHQIYYHKENDIQAYQVYKCINNRRSGSTLNDPNLNNFGSEKFAFESWKTLC